MRIRNRSCSIESLFTAAIGRYRPLMGRGLVQRRGWRRIALLCLLFLTALPRLLVPAGYMPGSGDRLDLMLCSGTGVMSIDLDRDHRTDPIPSVAHAPCAFSAAASPVLSAVPPLLLLDAIAYVVRLGVASVTVYTLDPAPHLRPPLRGPPSA